MYVCPNPLIEQRRKSQGTAEVDPVIQTLSLDSVLFLLQLKETSSIAVPRTFLISGKQRSLELQARYTLTLTAAHNSQQLYTHRARSTHMSRVWMHWCFGGGNRRITLFTRRRLPGETLPETIIQPQPRAALRPTLKSAGVLWTLISLYALQKPHFIFCTVQTCAQVWFVMSRVGLKRYQQSQRCVINMLRLTVVSLQDGGGEERLDTGKNYTNSNAKNADVFVCVHWVQAQSITGNTIVRANKEICGLLLNNINKSSKRNCISQLYKMKTLLIQYQALTHVQALIYLLKSYCEALTLRWNVSVTRGLWMYSRHWTT